MFSNQTHFFAYCAVAYVECSDRFVWLNASGLYWFLCGSLHCLTKLICLFFSTLFKHLCHYVVIWWFCASFIPHKTIGWKTDGEKICIYVLAYRKVISKRTVPIESIACIWFSNSNQNWQSNQNWIKYLKRKQ